MENTQFSFLNALLGGKFAGDLLAGGKADAPGDPAAKDAEGFFTFVDGLLKPASDSDDDVSAPLSDALFASQPAPFDPAGLPEVLVEKLAAPGVLKAGVGPIADPVAPQKIALALDGPKGPAPMELDALSASAMLGKDAVTPGGLAVLAQEAVTEKAATVVSQSELKSAPAVDQNISQPVDTLEIDPSLDGRVRDSASRFDAPAPGVHFDRSKIVLPPQANAALAIAENAAPDALAHSAVSREEGVSLDAERFTANRIELVSHAAERNAHLNPIRDQVVAAVAARQGDGKLEIRLDPPELGRVLIGFDRDGTDIVRAVISADSPETLDLMRRHADVFQRALEAQGFQNLDLHFADKGPGENADDAADEAFKNFRLADELAQGDPVTPAPHLIDGRLDRRL